MSIKKFTLINTLTGAVASIAVGLVTYFNPEYATAINASIMILTTAIVQCAEQFVKND